MAFDLLSCPCSRQGAGPAGGMGCMLVRGDGVHSYLLLGQILRKHMGSSKVEE